MTKKKSLDYFIQRAQDTHNNKYNYSPSKYINMHAKVEIICPEHGSFWQVAKSHLNGSGCARCSNRKSTLKDFLFKSRKIHDKKYDYSLVNYQGIKTKVEIICSEHGSFWQIPEVHTSGSGCPECSGKSKGNVSYFKNKALLVHGTRYIYDEIKYINKSCKIDILCPEHGLFSQRPDMHLSGQGCPTCSIKKRSSVLCKGKTNFINTAKKTHNNNYNYSSTNYTNNKTKVSIICDIHGEFWQTPNNHISKRSGCPKCATRGFNPDKEATLYYLYDPQEDLYKIGITNKDTSSRFGTGFIKERGIRIIMEESYSSGEQALLAEQELLQAFGNYRTTNPTWPEALGGKTEFFNRNILEL
jgi:protein-arginine kinase activator protein McsA